MNILFSLFSIIKILLVLSCVNSINTTPYTRNGDQSYNDDESRNIRTAQGKLMKQYIDVSTNPCDDFYQYACGNWEKYNPIPDDKAEYNAFSLLIDDMLISLKTVLEEDSSYEQLTNPIYKDSAEHKAKRFYASCMNQNININNNNNNNNNINIRNRRGAEPLLNLLEKYGGWPALNNNNWRSENFDWLNLTTHMLIAGQSSLIKTGVDGDFVDSENNVIYIDQSSLGLLNRDDFLLETNLEHLNAYKKLIEDILRILGAPEYHINKESTDIIDFEIKLAKILTDPKERLDLKEMYHSMTIDSLNRRYPEIDWMYLLSKYYDYQFDGGQKIVILTEDYFDKLIILCNKTPKRTIANYLLWRLVRDLVSYLDDRFDRPLKDFDEALIGIKSALPKWKDCVTEVNTGMRYAVASMYIRRYFDEASKDDVANITRDIQHTFLETLNYVEWMDYETKLSAGDKLNHIKLAVGYPDFIFIENQLNKKYYEMDIDVFQYFENNLNNIKYLIDEDRKTFNMKTNREEWPLGPVIVNAVYEQNKNRVLIPAGILQPPIYNRHYPKSLNFGGMGVFIGHEITHGFDDTGKDFDSFGNMKNWWSNHSTNGFNYHAQCFITQYNEYSINGKFMHGAASQGENIADNGGLRQSFISYKKWLVNNRFTKAYQNEGLPGMTMSNERLFFLSFAQAWCGAIRTKAIENRLETDYHGLGRFRVIGALSNLNEFAEVYNCPIGSKMNPINKCKLW